MPDFGSAQVDSMLAIGRVGPRSARIWFRSHRPELLRLELQPHGGPARSIQIDAAGRAECDHTAALTYPDDFPGEPLLEPLQRYRVRLIHEATGDLLAAGAFQTAPGSPADTPDRVTVAVLSCHQPFTEAGTIHGDAQRMLSAVPAILAAHDVKLVLMGGDQIYADDPDTFSLTNDAYLRTLCGKQTLTDCDAAEVRRLYHQRYRIFWEMPALRKLYAFYPSYPAIDDHEIIDDWGSLAEHGDGSHDNLYHGARLAHYDYQMARILPLDHLPPAFYYEHSYGDIGIFVMDLRSERAVRDPNQIYSEAQLNDFRDFLGRNTDKRALLIVTSVPVIHLPRWLADLGNSFTGDSVDFHDHWSFAKNRAARDRFLEVLHDHQQAHPDQRVALVGGDVHVGAALSIHWRGGQKPRLYQLTSSAVTNKLGLAAGVFSNLGPNSVLDFDTSTGPRARVKLLRGTEPMKNFNPYRKLHIGLIEIRRRGDHSTLTYRLVGVDDDGDPRVVFETGEL